MSIKMQIFLTWFELIAFSLVYIVFIGSAITFILSYFSRRIKRRTICIVFLDQSDLITIFICWN